MARPHCLPLGNVLQSTLPGEAWSKQVVDQGTGRVRLVRPHDEV